MKLEKRKIQQYKILVDGDVPSGEIGQFIFLNGNTEIAAGFVSNTDGLTFIQVTLFDPVDAELLPSTIFEALVKVDAMAVFDSLADDMSEYVLKAWSEAIDESRNAFN